MFDIFNKRKTTQVAVKTPTGKTQVYEAHGLIMCTITDKGGHFTIGNAVIGNMSIADLITLKNHIENKLLPHIQELIDEGTKDVDTVSLAQLIEALAGKEG